MPIKKPLKQIGYKETFMPQTSQFGSDWKQMFLRQNKQKALLKKRNKK